MNYNYKKISKILLSCKTAAHYQSAANLLSNEKRKIQKSKYFFFKKFMANLYIKHLTCCELAIRLHIIEMLEEEIYTLEKRVEMLN